MKPESFRKQALSLAAFILAAAAVFALARLRSDPAGKRAEFIVQQLLSCTVHVDSAASTAAADSEPGLVSVDDGGLTAFFRAQFADSVTDACLEQMLGNRLPTRITALAAQYGDKLEPTQLRLTRRKGDAVCYDFSAQLQTVTDKTAVAAASGTITMVNEDGVWKASSITLTVR